MQNYSSKQAHSIAVKSRRFECVLDYLLDALSLHVRSPVTLKVAAEAQPYSAYFES